MTAENINEIKLNVTVYMTSCVEAISRLATCIGYLRLLLIIPDQRSSQLCIPEESFCTLGKMNYINLTYKRVASVQQHYKVAVLWFQLSIG